MTDEAALLRAILAAPDVDVPRLVYADWLEEHGQRERAEFIRIQVELASIDVRPMDPVVFRNRYEPLRHRERELLDANAHIWLFDLPPGMRPILPDAIRDTYSRGFVSNVTCSWQDWRTHADAITAAQPIERVTLTDRPVPNSLTRSEVGFEARFHWPEVKSICAVSSIAAEGDLATDLGFQKMIGWRWPRIAFELPTLRPTYTHATAANS